MGHWLLSSWLWLATNGALARPQILAVMPTHPQSSLPLLSGVLYLRAAIMRSQFDGPRDSQQ